MRVISPGLVGAGAKQLTPSNDSHYAFHALDSRYTNISGASIKVTNLAFVASEELPISPMANIELTTGAFAGWKVVVAIISLPVESSNTTNVEDVVGTEIHALAPA